MDKKNIENQISSLVAQDNVLNGQLFERLTSVEYELLEYDKN